MSKVCQLSGKKPSMGHNVSHSNRKTKRRFNPNLVTKKIVDPVTGKKLKVTMSVRAQRTLLKNPAKYAVALTKIRKKQNKRNQPIAKKQ